MEHTRTYLMIRIDPIEIWNMEMVTDSKMLEHANNENTAHGELG